MKKLKTILSERLNLDNTQKAAIAYISTAPTPQMAYFVVTGARNSVSARNSLNLAGYVEVDPKNKIARLTAQGEEVLKAENLVDEMGELTERGTELLDKYMNDRQEWQTAEAAKPYESFKYLG